MALLRWIGVGPFQQQHQLLEQPKEQQSLIKPVSRPDAKRYGFENSGNTCYANSVLQALYFCSPFRELVCNTPDRSYLYPPPPIQHPAASQTTAPAAYAKSANHSKPATTPYKRGPGAAHAAPDSKADPHTAPDVDGKDANTAPPIPSHSPTLFAALRYLFLHVSHRSVDHGTIAPTAFIAKLRRENELFRNTQHQDAHEFLNYLLNKIVEELEQEDREDANRPSLAPSQEPQDDLSKSVGSLASSASPSTTPSTSTNNDSGTSTSSSSGQPTSHATLVHNLFEGILTSETRCLTCETVSSRDESFLDLSIDIEQNSSVTACLRQFSASEMLCQRNKFFCDACCGLQEAEKRMKIKHSPNILALHLKRFKYQEELQKYVKLSYRVAFPFELRLFNTVDDAVNPDRLYELFAIVVHIGSGPHHGHYITIIKAQGSWVVFDDDSVEAIKESEIPKYFGEGSSGAYVLFYQAVDMNRESLGLPPDLPTPSAVEVVNSEGAVVSGVPANLVDPLSLPPDAPGVPPMSKGGEEVVASPPAPLPNGKGPATPLHLDLPPPAPALNTSPGHSPVLAESFAKANTPGLSKGAAGFFQSLRHSTSSKVSMAKEKETREKEVVPPLPPTPLLNGDLFTNGHAHQNAVKEKEAKEGGGIGVGGNIFRRSLRTKKREPISVHPTPVGGSTAVSASPHLPSSVPPSPKHYRRPSVPQVQHAPTLVADETNNAVPPLLPLPMASLPLPTRGSTLEDTNATNATASMSSSWTSASAPAPPSALAPSPGPASAPGVLSPVALPLPFTPSLSLAQDTELPLPVLPPDRVPSPAGSSSGRTGTGSGTGMGMGMGAGTAAGIGNPSRSSHSKSNSSEFFLGPDPFSMQNSNNNSSSGHGQLAPSNPWTSTTPPRVPLAHPRPFKLSLGGGDVKRPKAAARAATEDAQVREREREREKKALEEKMQKEKEEKEKEREREKERDQQQQQQNNKPQKRKMSLSGMTVVGRLGASFGWSKDKEKHVDKDKDKGSTGMSLLPPSNEPEQDLPLLPPERLPGYLAIGASPRFNL